ncbi:MAG: hypothetical protein OEM20_05990 [Gammaproteobacteria bacterium]|nr:hypothetical protein [Gammaproteobacteria bacterium]
MVAKGKWFESAANKTADQEGFGGSAREIAHCRTKGLPMGMDAVAGYSIINAESLDEAEKIAKDN